MVEKTDSQEPTETLKPGEATAIDETVPPPEPAPAAANEDQVEPPNEDQVEVDSKLLRDLPMLVVHQLTALAVGDFAVLGQTTRKRMLGVRVSADLYAVGQSKAKDEDTRDVVEAMRLEDTRGGRVYSLADLRGELARRTKGGQ